MPERIVLHIGATKTGTSAIQSALARNRDRLLTQGALYPEGLQEDKAQAGRVTSGNGHIFRRFRKTYEEAAGLACQEFEAALQNTIATRADADTVLFSNEALGGLNQEALADLQKIFARYFRVVRLVYYVRHLADHAVSQYGEYIKRRKMKMPFERFTEKKYRAPFKKAMATVESVFSPTEIDYVLYDDVRRDLYRDFLRRLQISSDGHLSPNTVNRSFTYDELEVLREVNSLGLPKSLLARIAEDYAFRNEPPRQIALPVSRSAIDFVGARNRDVIEFANERLGSSQLRVASDELMAKACNDPELGEPELDRNIVVRILESGQRVMKEREVAFGERVKAKRRKLKSPDEAATPLVRRPLEDRLQAVLARAREMACASNGLLSDTRKVLLEGMLLIRDCDLINRGYVPETPEGATVD